MKRFITILLTALLAIGAFAYEPKKENVTVKRNGDFKYYEKTEPYEARCDWTKDYDDYVCWVIRKGYTVEQCVDYEYKMLESSRKSYYFYMDKAVWAKPDAFQTSVTKLLNEMNGTDISPVEYTRKSWLKSARKERAWAVAALPFVTEENYYELTKEEMKAKMYAFISECTK